MISAINDSQHEFLELSALQSTIVTIYWLRYLPRITE